MSDLEEALGAVEAEAEAERRATLQLHLRKARAEIAAQEREIEQLRKRLELHEAVETSVHTVPTWTRPTNSGGHHGTLCAVLSDTHYGEVVRASEIDRLNAYDPKIAEKRTRAFFERTLLLARDYVRGITFDGAVLFLTGDILSGDIHDELSETNAETSAESIVHFLGPVEAGIRMLADDMGRVVVPCVVGNHGRRTRKPRAKRRAADNMDWLFYKALERDLAGDARISVVVSDAADVLVPVYGTRFLATHGDQFRGGSGIAGMMSPLMLGQHRKTRRQMAAGRTFDWLVMGHWHQYWQGKGIIVSGALKGYDEFAYVSNFEYEPPRLAWWVTTPERGVTISAPVEPMDRRAERW